jgi:hypothetical protein
MRPGAILINTARGAVVDEAAMIDALQSGNIAYFGLDVFNIEPLPSDHPLTKLPNVTPSAHSAFLGGPGTNALPRLRHGQSRRSQLSHRDHRDCRVLGRWCHFGLVPYCRLSYAAFEQNLREAVMRISNACKELT